MRWAAGACGGAAGGDYLRVDVLVPQVVDRAPGAAHHEGTDGELGHEHGVREAARGGCDGDAPPAGPEEEPGSDRLVQPGEKKIGFHTRRC